MNVIDFYRFGQITVNGKKYTSDVIISGDKIKDGWWRKGGHHLQLEDIAEVIAENPQVLIIGTGASGLLKVPPEVNRAVEVRGIKLIVETTDKACYKYNQLCRSQKTVAALHITC
jgi:hypothetical protein